MSHVVRKVSLDGDIQEQPDQRCGPVVEEAREPQPAGAGVLIYKDPAPQCAQVVGKLPFHRLLAGLDLEPAQELGDVPGWSPGAARSRSITLTASEEAKTCPQ